MNKQDLDYCLRHLIMHAISASESVATATSYKEIDSVKERLEKELADAVAWILEKTGEPVKKENAGRLRLKEKGGTMRC